MLNRASAAGLKPLKEIKLAREISHAKTWIAIRTMALETWENQCSPVVLVNIDSQFGISLAAGFSLDLTHYAMHALGSRM